MSLETHYRDPQKIYQDIYKALGDESGLDLVVNNGIVTVCGMVDTEDTISWVVEKIKNVKGVSDVVEQIKVKPFH